jgi:hypothetical protein
MAQFVLDTSQLDIDVLGPIVYATASADLQGLTATAIAKVTNVVTATANLGGLSASVVIPQEQTASSSTGYSFVQPNFLSVEPEPEIEIIIKTVLATAKTKMAGIKASAESRIDFSIIEDDAEILLLI